jgi:hypothetical protein
MGHTSRARLAIAHCCSAVSGGGRRFSRTEGDTGLSKLPTIVDNRDVTVLLTLRPLLPKTQQLDVATGVFDIGSLMDLDGDWQSADRTRILMGEDTTRRTRRVLLEAVLSAADASIEHRRQDDDSLTGLPAIRDALAAADTKILCRIYSRAKFHAKAYMLKTHSLADPGQEG